MAGLSVGPFGPPLDSPERCSVCNGFLGVGCALEGPRSDCPRTQFLTPPRELADRAFPELVAKLTDETMRDVSRAVHAATLDELVDRFRELPVEDLAFLQGAVFQLLAMHVGKTEAELYADWLRRAEADPDCNVVREYRW